MRSKMIPGTGKARRNTSSPKILVLSAQQPIISLGASHHIDVNSSGFGIRHIDDVMPRTSKMGDQHRIDTFIDQPTHASSAVDKFFIGESRKCLCHPYVIKHEARMICDDRLRGHSRSQLAQNELNRHASSPNDGLATHNIGITLDSVMHHWAAPLQAIMACYHSRALV
jgi:hypothetical protein